MLQINEVLVESDIINKIYKNKKSEVRIHLDTPAAVNQYFVFRSFVDKKHAALVRYLGNDNWNKVSKSGDLTINGISPKDAHQSSFVDAMLDDSLLLNVAIGTAGTGKTTLAMSYALNMFFTESKNIILSKPTSLVGSSNAFGPVPGDIDEKYSPYLSSYEIILNKIASDKGTAYVKMLKEKKVIQYVPVELARGCTYDNCTFILDEAQNLNWHELNTIVSRMGNNTKMIILGDLNQIDTNMAENQTGLFKMINSEPFKDSKITTAVELVKQYRSPITQLIADVDQWLKDDEKGTSSTSNNGNSRRLFR